MRLNKLRIRGFRSVKNEETLFIDHRTTILIGANDHGKSNLLAAIHCLNDDRLIKQEDRNWDLGSSDPVEIRWHFDADETVIKKLTDLGPQEPSYAEMLSAPVGSIPQGDLPSLLPINKNNEVVFGRDLATNKVNVVSVPAPVLASNEESVLALRPRVEVFEAPTQNVVDQVTRNELETPAFEFMQGIFRFAGLWESRDTIFTNNDKTSRQLAEASEKLTNILIDQWNQGKSLKWFFNHTGSNGDTIRIQIQDPAIKGQYTRPSQRSSGFRTYFLLSMIVYARSQKTPDESHIYLFDEPGTYLHPSAQLDLQRTFEAIADQSQLIYTTHSIFLISKNYPARNRVVSKAGDGTKIDQRPFTKNWKSVRQSLGILLSNNFLIAEKTLLVEGPSDARYFLDALKRMKAAGKIDADLNDLSIVDAGDSQNYIVMAKILLSEGRSIVALADGDSAGKKLQAQLKQICEAEINTKKLQIHLLQENRSSEDVFADITTIRKATRSAFQKLIEDRLRTAKAGFDIEQAVERIKSSPDVSLGRTIDLETRSWFVPEDTISKLLIATLYEDEADKSDAAPPATALSELEKIKSLLGLRDEKSKQEGVFEEIDTVL